MAMSRSLLAIALASLTASSSPTASFFFNAVATPTNLTLTHPRTGQQVVLNGTYGVDTSAWSGTAATDTLFFMDLNDLFLVHPLLVPSVTSIEQFFMSDGSDVLVLVQPGITGTVNGTAIGLVASPTPIYTVFVNVACGDDDDVVWCGSGNDHVDGGAGNDTIDGGEGDDALYGGSGNDHINGGPGWDLIYGGPGDDHLLTEDGGALLEGQDGDDVLIGGDHLDVLRGGAGNDELFGGVGDDILEADEGDDILHGEDGDDRLYSDGGNDLLIAGNGDDDLYFTGTSGGTVAWGGFGSDQFGVNIPTLLTGHHIIEDYSGFQGDTIVLPIFVDTLTGLSILVEYLVFSGDDLVIASPFDTTWSLTIRDGVLKYISGDLTAASFLFNYP